jgi:DNA-binding NarL/FixJ family response regulator
MVETCEKQSVLFLKNFQGSFELIQIAGRHFVSIFQGWRNRMDAKKDIKVMIVGDFLIFRNGLKMLLETTGTIKVVGEAVDLADASLSLPKIKPNVLLIDSDEIDKGNFAFFLSSQTNYTPIVVLTGSRNAENHQNYLLLGADGLVSKEQTAEVLFRAIRLVSEGDVFFDRKLMSDTIKQLVNERKSIPEKFYSYNCAALTEREREVLTQICRGMKNKFIAENLYISETTVRHHLTSIFEKLKVKSRLELVVHAFKEKMVEIPFEMDNSTLDYK